MIPPLHMSSLLPHDLCHGRSSSHWVPTITNSQEKCSKSGSRDASHLRFAIKNLELIQSVGWHHRLNEHKFEHALGVADGQGGLVCYSPWGSKESDMTERLKAESGQHCCVDSFSFEKTLWYRNKVGAVKFIVYIGFWW